jgi:hypothetical protein
MKSKSPNPSLRLFSILLPLILTTSVVAQNAAEHTYRILFLDGPDAAPDTLHLFDGVGSQEVDLPRMNLSKVYQLRSGDLTLRMLTAPVKDPDSVPAGAPSVTVAAAVEDFYLLVTSDPDNKVAPVRMQVIAVGSGKLKPGQMLWFNLTENAVGGTIGTETLAIRPKSRLVLDSPASGNTDYTVNLSYRIAGDERLYPLCETQWLHDPRSRSLAFIITNQGVRAPRILVFPDYREKEKKEKPER